MSDEFTVSAFIPALPMAVYLAWLDGVKHSEITGHDAHCEPLMHTQFDAWDGYIHGTNVALDPGRLIVQSWRTAEFPSDAPDSRIEITLRPEGNGTRLILRHFGIPDGQGALYEQGWHDHYFRPMQEYFVNAGISGVPYGARVTEVIRKVQIGEAAPTPDHADSSVKSDYAGYSPSEQNIDDVTAANVASADENIAEPEDAETELEQATYDPPADRAVAPADSGFELADDEEPDDFDTTRSDTSRTTTEDFWKHLEPPTETKRPETTQKETPAVEPPHVLPAAAPLGATAKKPGRRPARRNLPPGAGKPSRKGKAKAAKGRKPAARKTKKPSPGTKQSSKKTKPKRSTASQGKRAATTKKASLSAKRKRASASTKKAPAKKKPAAKAKPTNKAAKKPTKKATGSTTQASKKTKPKRSTAPQGKRAATTKQASLSAKRKRASTSTKKPATKKKAPAKKKTAAKPKKQPATKKKAPAKKTAAKKKPAAKKAPAKKKPAAKAKPAKKRPATKKKAATKKPAKRKK